jgi:hypothetical protein
VVKSVAGFGNGIRLILTAGSQDSSASTLMMYDSPQFSKSSGVNFPATGGIAVFRGKNFALHGFTQRVSLGFSCSSLTKWVSDSFILSRAESGIGNQLPVTLSVSKSETYADALISRKIASYNGIAVNFANPSSIPSTGSGYVQVLGLSMGVPGVSSNLRILFSSPSSSVWISDSCMVIKTATSIGGFIVFTGSAERNFQENVQFFQSLFKIYSAANEWTCFRGLYNHPHGGFFWFVFFQPCCSNR